MIVFKWLKSWFALNKNKFAQNGITFSFWESVTKTDNPAQVVDIDTKTQMARVTLWETGDCNFEALENETGKIILFENQVIKSEDELKEFLDKVFAKL